MATRPAITDRALERTLQTLGQGVEDLAIEHRASPLGKVTVSLGASLTRMNESSRLAHREGFASADMALYRLKHSGRNQVTMSEPERSAHAVPASTTLRRVAVRADESA